MEGSRVFVVEEVGEKWKDEDGGVGWCGAHFLRCSEMRRWGSVRVLG